MILEAKQQYRGVLCLHCRQPIPLSSFAASKECGFKEREASGCDESTVRSFTVSSFTLRCRVCEGEGLYTALDVQILYRPDQNQMTIWVTITDATPQAIQELLDDPRTDTSHPAETAHASSTASSTPNFGTPAQHTLW